MASGQLSGRMAPCSIMFRSSALTWPPSTAFYGACLCRWAASACHGLRRGDRPWSAPQARLLGRTPRHRDGFRESHVAFSAPDRASVRAFFDAAVARGAETLHEPRLWPESHASCYGAFVRDPDGNKRRGRLPHGGLT